MKRKPVVCFTIADHNNVKWALMLEKSLRKFHTKQELPLEIIAGHILDNALKQDSQFFYRAKPVVASQLIENYEVVIGADAYSIITAPINEAWEGDFDVKLVLNSNPREHKAYPVGVWDIDPIHEYVNCGFVSMRSKEFVDHWHRLCYSPRFERYPMREQDFLNIIVHYGNYNCQLLENTDQFWGLSSKGYWADIKLDKDKLILPANDEWNKNDRIIRVIHWGGGNDPNKMNFNTRFQPEVAKFLNDLVK